MDSVFLYQGRKGATKKVIIHISCCLMRHMAVKAAIFNGSLVPMFGEDKQGLPYFKRKVIENPK